MRPSARRVFARALLPTLLIPLLALVAGCSDSTEPGLAACPDTPGTICTWAGNGVRGYDGDEKPPLESSFYWPVDITFAPNGEVFVVDYNNHRIRVLKSDGRFHNAVGTWLPGDGPLPGDPSSDLIAPGAPGDNVSLNHPTQIVPLPNDKLLILGWHNHKLRTYDPATDLALVTCGAGPGFAGDGGPARDALIKFPCMAAVSGDGVVYLLDQLNQRIRRIGTDDIITTVVGTGTIGFSGDGGDPAQAQLHFSSDGTLPSGGVTLDDQGRLYIADSLNNRIRRVDFAANRIETVVGDGVARFGGDDGPPLQASLNEPRDIAFGPDGRLYIADKLNHRIRAVDFDADLITTVAGNGTAGFSGDGGPAVDASLDRPEGFDFGPDGNLYIVDSQNNRIRRVAF